MNYKIIDPIIQTTSGVLAGFLVGKLIPHGWSMPATMLAGGACGMAQTLVTMIPLMALLGSFEVMIPMMLTNMTTGMLAGTSVSLWAPPEGCLALTGAIIGMIIYGLVSNSNRKLVGE